MTASRSEDAAPTVVVVEDDPSIADLLDLYLRQGGFRPVLAADAAHGLACIERHEPSIVILDIGLPGDQDGLDVLKQIRADGSLPVMMLTARDDEIDRILGLELGADDYVAKPFSPREVVARVRAILRRGGATEVATPKVHEVGPVRVDPSRREVAVDGAVVHLATREFDLLLHLAEHEGIVLSRQQLLDGVWGPEWFGDERTVDVHVRQLRRKLGDGFDLHTVWGVGYRLG